MSLTLVKLGKAASNVSSPDAVFRLLPALIELPYEKILRQWCRREDILPNDYTELLFEKVRRNLRR